MKCVDLLLRDVPHFMGWEKFVRLSYICHRCEKTIRGDDPGVFYFPSLDYFYHKHDDDVYYRAFPIMENGVIRIGGSDSETEDVIQRHAIQLDKRGDYKHVGDLRASSKEFFESMRRQHRTVSNTEVRIRFG